MPVDMNADTIVHALDAHHKDLNAVRKLNAEVVRLLEARVAMRRGKHHVADAYLFDAVNNITELLEKLGVEDNSDIGYRASLARILAE